MRARAARPIGMRTISSITPERGAQRERRDDDRQEIEPAERREEALLPGELEAEAERREGEQERPGEGADREEGHAGEADPPAEGAAPQARAHQRREVEGRRDHPDGEGGGEPRAEGGGSVARSLVCSQSAAGSESRSTTEAKAA